jgi:hypothetical protein
LIIAAHWITVLEIIPAFSLYRGLYELSQYAIRASETGNPGMRWSDLSDRTNGMRNVLIIIIVEWLVLLPVAYYFDHAAAVGHRSSPLSVIKRLLRKKPTWTKRAVNEVAARPDNDVHVEMEKLDIIKEVSNLYCRPSLMHTVQFSTSHLLCVVSKFASTCRVPLFFY